MQSILEHIFHFETRVFQNNIGMYICEYCEINGFLTVITECWKLPHGGNFRQGQPSLLAFYASDLYNCAFGLKTLNIYYGHLAHCKTETSG